MSLTAQKVITYNIKNDYQKTGENNWNSRKAAMVQLLNHYAPDIFGVQEALNNQLEYLDSSLVDYSYFGVGRDDAKQRGEYCAIFFLTFGLFQCKETNQKFWLFNTHFDHIGVKARVESVKLIIKKINELNTEGLPVILIGDFNLTPDQKPIQLLQENFSDAFLTTKTPFYGPEGTFNGFTNRKLDKRIDYCFVKNLTVKNCIHIDDRMANNKHISDHLPVLIEVIY